MRISYGWLKEFTGIGVSPQELGEKLVSLGFEVLSVDGSGPDAVIEAEITPNRGDCLSTAGFAREISCAYNTVLELPGSSLTEAGGNTEGCLSVEIRDPELCPRYAARVIKGVKIGPSPSWMSRRLESLGVRPINNVVDVTNYVLLETGQPIHAFDHSLISGGRIIVRTARQGESLVTLDGVERKLSSGMLVIADEKRAVALAGIMGGANSEVNGATRDVVIESACFNASSIRKTCHKLGMETEASYRFERHSDINEARASVDRVCFLVRQVAGGDVLKGAIDRYPVRRKTARVRVRDQRIADILGTAVPKREASRILKKLGFKLKQGKSGFTAVVPSWRQPDVSAEIDVIEEIARHYGYDRIQPGLPVLAPAAVTDKYGSVGSGTLHLQEIIRDSMCAAGFSECINYGLMKGGIFSAAFSDRSMVRVLNPLDEEMACLRPSAIPWLFENLAFNFNRDARSAMLFEVGRIFNASGRDLPEERIVVSAVICGKTGRSWNEKERVLDFFDIKGHVQFLFDRMRVSGCSFGSAADPCPFADNTAGLFAEGEMVGIAGKLKEEIASSRKLAGDAYFFEIDIAKLAGHIVPGTVYSPVSRFPSVARDAALLVPDGMNAGDVADLIRKEGGDMLKSIRLFDFYQGGQVPAGYKSMGFSLTYQSAEKTLTDGEVNGLHFKIFNVLDGKGVKLRS